MDQVRKALSAPALALGPALLQQMPGSKRMSRERAPRIACCVGLAIALVLLAATLVGNCRERAVYGQLAAYNQHGTAGTITEHRSVGLRPPE